MSGSSILGPGLGGIVRPLVFDVGRVRMGRGIIPSSGGEEETAWTGVITNATVEGVPTMTGGVAPMPEYTVGAQALAWVKATAATSGVMSMPGYTVNAEIV